MALSDKNILITPNIGQNSDPKIVFSGADVSSGPQNITMQVYPSSNGTLLFEGSAGQLFSITNSLTGTIYSVNDVSGMPSIEVLHTGLIKLAQYSGNILVGTGTDNGTDKLQVNGAVLATTFKGAVTGNVTGNATTATTLQTARTIGGVSFDGSANINLPGVNTAGNQNTTGSAATLTTARTINGVSFDGSANITVADSTKLPLAGGTMTGAITFAAGQTWPTFNQNTTGSAATLTTARTINGVSFNGSANITVTATATNALTIGTGLSGTSYNGSSAVTIALASGYGDTLNPYASKTANYVLAAPNGAAGVPTFRAIVAADIPTLNQNTTGTASNVTGTVAIANGGTGSTSAAGALSALGAYAATNPSGYTTNTGTVTSVGGTGTVSGLTLTGTVTTTGNLTLGGTLSASIDNISDEHRLFNNMGDGHSARTAFDATTPSYNFGWRYVAGSTNGPGTGGGQFYSLYVGLGNEYAATGAGSYGMFMAIDRNSATPYLSIRYNEANSLSTWRKIYAGAADVLTTGRNINGTSFNGSADITTANWGTARTLWGSSVNGSANITAPLLPDAGTVALPAFSTSGDTNTGIFFPAADTIAFAEGGAEAMRITSTGNVGIGTSSPGGKLDVNGTVRLGMFDINLTTANSAVWIEGSDFGIGTYYGVALKLLTSNTERMRISSAGIISLGPHGAESLRVTPVASAVNYWNVQGDIGEFPKLSAQGSSTNVSMVYATKGAGSHFLQTNGSVTQLLIAHTASAVNYLQVTGAVTTGAPVLSSEGSDTNINLLLTPKGTGGVGIGITPTQKLHVSGNILATGTVTGSNLSGTNTGDQTTITGNAGTATLLQTARTINGVSFNGSANITVTATATNALTIGTGLSGTSYNGSGAVTIAIDSTVATLTGSQTLTNKTLTFPIIDNIRMGHTSTATAAGTTVLTATSTYQQRFTGTTTQTITLPVTSTLAIGVTYSIENTSTGNLTVNSSGGNLVATVIPGTTIDCTCIGITLTTAADWDPEYRAFASITGTGSVVMSTSPTLVTPALGTPSSGNLANCTFPTLNQNTTGSAATLTTARTINGTSFNGSANITTANWGTARTLWGQSVDGSANITSPLLPAAGTAALPAFSTSGDTNTGMYFSAADTIGFAAGGVIGFSVGTAASAVNYLEARGAATANSPRIVALGSDTNVPITFVTKGTGEIRFTTNSAERMRIDGSGNVSIGTTTTVSGFHVAANIGTPSGNGVFSGIDGGYGAIQLNGSTGGFIDFSTSGTDYKGRIIYGHTSNIMTFFANGIDRGSINDKWTLLSAQVGGYNDRTLNLDGPSISQPGIGFHAPANSSAGCFLFNGTGPDFSCVNSTNSGYIPIIASSFTIGSDYRLKTDIVDLQSGLQDIMNLSPKKYTLFDSDKESRGFIAHEVSPHIPEAVSGEFNAEDERGFPVYQTLDPAAILATAVVAIQELKVLIDQQAIEIQQLKEKLNA